MRNLKIKSNGINGELFKNIFSEMSVRIFNKLILMFSILNIFQHRIKNKNLSIFRIKIWELKVME